MIEINILDSPAYVIGNYSGNSKKKGTGIILLIIILVVIPLLSIFLVKSIFDLSAREEQDIEVEQRAGVREREISEENLGSSALSEIFLSSASYENMAKWERVNYEVKFNALALEEFSKLVPDGITFNNIRIFDYKTIVAEGTAPSRNSLTEFFGRLKTDEWTLLPRPQTNIRDGGTFYRFRIEVNYLPSLSHFVRDPINPQNTPDILRLGVVKDGIERLMRSSGLRNTSLRLENSINEPDEKIYTYALRFEGNFQNSLDFLKALSTMREPIRSESITMNYGARAIEGRAVISMILQ